MEEKKRRLYVEPDGFCTEAAILFMVLAVVFRMIGSIGRWDDMHYLITQVALPVFSGLLMILCLLLFAKRAFWTTVIPVVCGVAFFIFRILEVENEWQMVGCIVLYVVIVVLYTMTFSHPKLKWLLALVLLAAFSFHVWQDMQSLLDGTREQPVGFLEGMQELSILGIMLSLLSLSLAMKMPKAAPAKAEEPAPEPEKTEEKKAEEKKGRKHRRGKEEKKPEPAPVPAEVTEPSPEPAPEQMPESEPEPAPEPEPALEPELLPEELPEAELPGEPEEPLETVILPEESEHAEPLAAYPLEEETSRSDFDDAQEEP